jgi:hypothetical protein
VRRALALTLLATALAGCSSSSSSGSQPASHAASTPPASSSSTFHPADTGGRIWPRKTTGDGWIGLGTRIKITDQGFWPRELFAPMGYILTWTNVSGRIASVHFDNYGERVDSGPIAPGKSWSFNATRLAMISYHSTIGTHFHAVVRVQQTGNS